MSREFDYMLLDRCKQDCKYYLGFGNRNPKNLYGGSEKEIIKTMLDLFDSFPPNMKPEWLTRKEILEFAKQMGVRVPRMTPTELKKKHQQNFPESNFFSRETMRFWGSKMSTMQVEKDLKTLTTVSNVKHDCYVLLSRGKNAFTDESETNVYYFDSETFRIIHIKE